MTTDNLTQRIAKLARIELGNERAEANDSFDSQFDSIIQYIGQIESVSIPDGTEPYFGATEMTNATREDVVKASYPREQMLGLAPKSDGEFYRVPPVFES